MQVYLTAVADSINTARLLADRNEATAPQSGVYGALVEALKDTLALILGTPELADTAYDAILNGDSVSGAVGMLAPVAGPADDPIVGYIAPEDEADGVMTPIQNFQPGYALHGTPIPEDWRVIRQSDTKDWTTTL